jgi:putative acetyltransferase
MQIRPEHPEDVDTIRSLMAAGFKDMPYSSHTEAAIIDALRRVLSQFLTVDTEIPECMVGSYATSVLNCSASERFELQEYFACPLRIM